MPQINVRNSCSPTEPYILKPRAQNGLLLISIQPNLSDVVLGGKWEGGRKTQFFCSLLTPFSEKNTFMYALINAVSLPLSPRKVRVDKENETKCTAVGQP